VIRYEHTKASLAPRATPLAKFRSRRKLLCRRRQQPVSAFRSVAATRSSSARRRAYILRCRRQPAPRLRLPPGERFISGHANPAISAASPTKPSAAPASGNHRTRAELATADHTALFLHPRKFRFVSSGTEATMSAVRLAAASPSRFHPENLKAATTDTRQFLSQAAPACTLGIAECPESPKR